MADKHAPKFNEYLYEARQAKGLGVRQAAKAIGIAHSRLLDFEAGVDQHTGRPCLPRTSTLFKIAEAYELDIGEVLRITGFELPGLPNTPEERRLLALFRTLSPANRVALASFLEGLATDG